MTGGIARTLNQSWFGISERDRMLRVVQPGLLGLTDGTLSTLAPIFAAAYIAGSRAAVTALARLAEAAPGGPENVVLFRKLFVRWERQELLELVTERHALEQCARLLGATLRAEELVAHLAADALELLGLQPSHQLT